MSHRLGIVFAFLTLILVGCKTAQHAAVPMRAPFVDVKEYGATGDGKTLDTAAFASAIDSIKAKGGTVVVPPGTYYVGPIDFVSNMTLMLQEGATLLFSDNPDDYPLVVTRWEGIMREAKRPLLWARDCKNVAIVGKGTIDGNGQRWWDGVRQRRAQRIAASGPSVTTQMVGIAPDNPHFRRPPVVQFRDCDGVLIDGVTIQNSPFWQTHLLFSDNIVVRNATFLAPSNAPNTDAMDIDSCRKVLVENCYADVGDDAFTLKSGRNEDGRRVGRPTEDVTVRNCVVKHAHGGVVIGSETSGDVRRIKFYNCEFEGTDAGVRIKTMRGRGAIVEDVEAHNITMKNVGQTFIITMRYQRTPQEEISERTPTVRNIKISNITSRDSRRAGIIDGLEERAIENITLSNLDITARDGFSFSYGSNVTLKNVVVTTDNAPAMTSREMKSLTVENYIGKVRGTTPTTQGAAGR